MIIRDTKREDLKRIAEIYNHYIENTTITFEYDAVSEEVMAERFLKYSEKYAYLTAEEDGEVLGYAYGSAIWERAAYKYSVELSVYIDKNHLQKGVGKALYNKLLPTLEEKGFKNFYARIAMPNDSSIALHEKFGFTKCGEFKDIGYKFLRWVDLVVMEKRLER